MLTDIKLKCFTVFVFIDQILLKGWLNFVILEQKLSLETKPAGKCVENKAV